MSRPPPGPSFEQLVNGAQNSAMALVQNMSEDQLRECLNDDAKLDALLQDLPQFNSMRTEREMLLAQNKSLAEWNMSQEPKLREARERLLESYEQTMERKTNMENAKKQLDELSQTRSLDTTLNLLKVAASEAEETSEKIAERLENDELDSNTFVDTFIPERMLSHSRKVKAEKLAEILRSQTYHPPTSSAVAAGGYPGRVADPIPSQWAQRQTNAVYPTW